MKVKSGFEHFKKIIGSYSHLSCIRCKTKNHSVTACVTGDPGKNRTLSISCLSKFCDDSGLSPNWEVSSEEGSRVFGVTLEENQVDGSYAQGKTSHGPHTSILLHLQVVAFPIRVSLVAKLVEALKIVKAVAGRDEDLNERFFSGSASSRCLDP